MASPAPRARIESVDLTRGVIMIVMALDHVRDFLAVPANPIDLATTTPGLFFTRWITHFCAPVFCLLTGVGARLSLGRKSRAELARFLWTRGLWLIALDTVVARCLVYQFNVDFQLTVLDVLWSLGWSMIALSGLIHAIAVVISAVSFGTVGGMFDSPTIDRYPVTFPPGWGYSLPGVYAAWIGVVIAVYPLCRWYAAVKRRRRDWWLGYL